MHIRREARHDILFEPVPIGPKTMRNRFYQSPHCCGFGPSLPLTHALFRGTKAEGGWAAVNTESCTVHPSSDASPEILSHLWDDEDARNLGLMAEVAHEHGALAGVELWYGGSYVTNLETRLPARSVSQFKDDFVGTSAYELDLAGIREVQQYFVDAARRARDVGFDIVNVHGAAGGSLVQHFLMEKYNRRTDQYGGAFENRARFWLEAIELVREAVGDDCAITARLCIDTLNDNPQGIRASEEAAGFIELANHLVDFWDLQVGGWNAANWMEEDASPSRVAPEFVHRELYAQARRAATKPVAGVGRFTNPDTMAAAIHSGVLDIIAAARPSIADPFLPRKIEEGRYGEICECIGCNICASRFPQAVPLICTQNPTAGEEYRRGWHPTHFTRAQNADRDVLVLGAGPAGLECARVLGERGMRRIHLIDEHDEPGGSLRLIRTLPGLGEWGRVIDYRVTALDRLRNVQLIRASRLSASDVVGYGAEIVVLATGSRWRRDGVHGASMTPLAGALEAEHVFAPEQVFDANGDIPGEKALVYDTDGYFMAAGLAQLLADRGKRVTAVTPFSNFGPYLFLTGEGPPVNRELIRAGVRLVTHHSIDAIHADAVVGAYAHGAAEVRWDADAVVLVTQRQPRDELFHEVTSDSDRLRAEGVEAVHRIGDCLAPRIIAECVFDGHRLAREIDAPDPAVPLPYRRELPRISAEDRRRVGLA